jgi:hypothetical protein
MHPMRQLRERNAYAFKRCGSSDVLRAGRPPLLVRNRTSTSLQTPAWSGSQNRRVAPTGPQHGVAPNAAVVTRAGHGFAGRLDGATVCVADEPKDDTDPEARSAKRIELHAHARISDPEPPRNPTTRRDSSKPLKRRFYKRRCNWRHDGRRGGEVASPAVPIGVVPSR